MLNAKFFILATALAGVSLAQITSDSPECRSRYSALGAIGPTLGPAVISAMKSLGFPSDGNEIAHPSEAIDRLCSFAAVIPQDALSQFGEYGSSLLHVASTELSSYEALVSNCVATGAEAASLISYVHHIVSQTEPLCPAVTRPPTGGNNGTVTITTPPTHLPTSSYPIETGSSTSSIPTAAAARPSGIFLGAGAVAGILGAAALL